MSSGRGAREVKIPPEAIRAAKEHIERLRIVQKTDPLRNRSIARNNTLRLTNPDTYISGSVANSASLLRRSGNALEANELAGGLRLSQNQIGARNANNESVRRELNASQSINYLNRGLGALTTGIAQREEGIAKGEEPVNFKRSNKLLGGNRGIFE